MALQSRPQPRASGAAMSSATLLFKKTAKIVTWAIFPHFLSNHPKDSCNVNIQHHKVP